jgi:hypothetical protein
MYTLCVCANGICVPVPFPMEAFVLCQIVVKFENMNVPKIIFSRKGKAMQGLSHIVHNGRPDSCKLYE